jgi:TolB-like protein/Flp pilus assembly protein TadD
VYSLGTLLYEMLTGRTPFEGLSAQAAMAQRIVGEAPPMRPVRPEVPAGLEAVVAKALARLPEARHQSAAELAAALVRPAGAIAGGDLVTTVVVPAAPPSKSIAVLPFVNMSNDPENEYFSDGIAEEIINALSAISALRVAARTSSFAFKGRHDDIGEIARRLRVTTVLEGSVRKSGQVLRVTAQLVDAAGGFQLWSARYDRKLEDVFAIQDEIASSIVTALEVVLSPREQRAIERTPASDVAAYDAYLRGRQAFHQMQRASLQLARRMFEQAIEIDPGYARAWAGAADACSFMFLFWDPSRSNVELAERYSARALELAPDLAEARTSRAQVLTLRGQYEDAEREFRQAITLNPNLYDAHYFYARALVQQGRNEDAIAQYREAWRIRPEDYQVGFLMFSPLMHLGRTAELDEVGRQALANAQRSLELNPDDARALYLGAGGLLREGRKEEALAWGARALAADPTDSAVLYNVACLHALVGDREAALDLITRAVDAGFGNRAWLEKDTDFDLIRDDPRFQAVIRRI